MSSTISAQTVVATAELARLALSETERLSLARQLEGVLALVETLDEVDTDGVTVGSDITGRRRSDTVTEGLDRDTVLAGAPRTDGGVFDVPRFVGD